MSLSNIKIPARSDLKIVVRSGKIIPVRSVRTFKLTTETTTTNVTPFLKHIRETVDTDAGSDTDSVEWKKNWMKDIIHNTLKSLHKIRWRKVRMLANLDKDCTTKQLITSLRNLYPILDEYYSFALIDAEIVFNFFPTFFIINRSVICIFFNLFFHSNNFIIHRKIIFFII